MTTVTAMPMRAECKGIDPAYPGLFCYLWVGHSGDCEFMTTGMGYDWRRRAVEAEAQIAEWHEYFHLGTRHWADTLDYAATALEGSDDRGDRYCADQLRVAIKVVQNRAEEQPMGMDPHSTRTVYLTPEERLRLLRLISDAITQATEDLDTLTALADLLVKVSRS